MAQFIIPPQKHIKGGKINVLGAKNAAIIMIAASCLFNGKTILDNVPDILDIQRILEIIKKMGGRFRRTGHCLEIDNSELQPVNPDPKLVGNIRASIVLTGPLLARFGKLKIPHPGGCVIGQRPIDLHLKAFKDMGVKIKETNGFFEFSFLKPLKKPLSAIKFNKVTVTGTENLLLFAAGLNHKVIIENAAIEPEVIDLIKFLKKAGVKIGIKNRRFVVFGPRQFKPVNHLVIPDRIEAGTFAILAATGQIPLRINQMVPEHLEVLLNVFQKIGVKFIIGKNFLEIKKSPELKAVDISTEVYPGFPTDLEPPIAVLLTQAKGTSRIRENIFENRLGYLEELKKMGAEVKIISPQEALIYGKRRLHGARIESLDLRAGATLLIAGLISNGTTKINHAENIDRGYEQIEKRLKNIGAKIQRVR